MMYFQAFTSPTESSEHFSKINLLLNCNLHKEKYQIASVQLDEFLQNEHIYVTSIRIKKWPILPEAPGATLQLLPTPSH